MEYQEASMPKLLYKYKSASDGFKLLEDCKIKISPPCQLNDGYELKPFVAIDEEKAFSEVLNGQGHEEYINELSKKGIKFSSREKAIEYIFQNETIIRKDIKTKLAEIKKSSQTYSERMSKQTAIYSTTKNNLSTLMWSHYSDGYKGICFGLDLDQISTGELHRVEYSSNRPSIDFEKVRNNDLLTKHIIEMVTTKGLEWNYEEEYRILINIDEKEFRKEIILYPILASTIQKICISRKFDDNNLHKLNRLLEREEYNSLEVFFIDYEIENPGYTLCESLLDKSRLLDDFKAKCNS